MLSFVCFVDICGACAPFGAESKVFSPKQDPQPAFGALKVKKIFEIKI
jgi:hypothetical protein